MISLTVLKEKNKLVTEFNVYLNTNPNSLNLQNVCRYSRINNGKLEKSLSADKKLQGAPRRKESMGLDGQKLKKLKICAWEKTLEDKIHWNSKNKQISSTKQSI